MRLPFVLLSTLFFAIPVEVAASCDELRFHDGSTLLHCESVLSYDAYSGYRESGRWIEHFLALCANEGDVSETASWRLGLLRVSPSSSFSQGWCGVRQAQFGLGSVDIEEGIGEVVSQGVRQAVRTLAPCRHLIETSKECDMSEQPNWLGRLGLRLATPDVQSVFERPETNIDLFESFGIDVEYSDADGALELDIRTIGQPAAVVVTPSLATFEFDGDFPEGAVAFTDREEIVSRFGEGVSTVFSSEGLASDVLGADLVLIDFEALDETQELFVRLFYELGEFRAMPGFGLVVIGPEGEAIRTDVEPTVTF